MLNWLKQLFAPAPQVKPRRKQKGHYRTYKSGKKVWVGPKK